jgi:hypothetical protein
MMRRQASVLAASAVAMALFAVAGAQSRPAANSVTFPDSDPSAENPANVDITSVVVSNDDAGNLTFQVNIGNQAALRPGMGVSVLLDADANAATGSPIRGAGVDDTFSLLPSGQVTFAHWNGTQFALENPPPSLTATYAATGATFHLNAKDIGNPKAFSFSVSTVAGAIGSGSSIQFDYAPESSATPYAYQVKIAVKLSAGHLRESPSPARVGKRLTVSLPVTESDTGGPIANGQVLCAARIAAKRLAARSKGIASGVAACRFQIPANAKGKTLHGAITVAVQDTRLKRTFSAHIR